MSSSYSTNRNRAEQYGDEDNDDQQRSFDVNNRRVYTLFIHFNHFRHF